MSSRVKEVAERRAAVKCGSQPAATGTLHETRKAVTLGPVLEVRPGPSRTLTLRSSSALSHSLELADWTPSNHERPPHHEA